MTVGNRPSASVVEEIAARRRADLAPPSSTAGPVPSSSAAAAAAPPPRDVAGRLAAPGLALIAEVKRSSPSAGPIAPASR